MVANDPVEIRPQIPAVLSGHLRWRLCNHRYVFLFGFTSQHVERRGVGLFRFLDLDCVYGLLGFRVFFVWDQSFGPVVYKFFLGI